MKLAALLLALPVLAADVVAQDGAKEHRLKSLEERLAPAAK